MNEYARLPSLHHNKSLYGLDWMTSRHPTVRRLKRQSHTALHGNKTWNASLVLVDYLSQHPLPTGTRVLELGCGWGLAGLYCASQQCQVTALDADDGVFPFLQAQANHNQLEVSTLTQDFSSISADQFAQVDVVIGSDICFWDDMAAELFHCINLALDSGVKTVIISDPNRPPFLDVADALVESHFAELFPWQSALSSRYRGSILLIENA